MAFLPNFSADVFVSYSHIDNEPFGEKETRWISKFHEDLEKRVPQLLGRPITIWRDPKLGGTDIFSEELKSQLKRSAILVSIVTPAYVQSDWCKRELQLFAEYARDTGGVRISNKNRVVKVLKTPVPREDLPEFLDSMLGYEFYRAESGTEIVREFLIDPSEEVRGAYWTRLDDVAQEIRRLLHLLGQRRAGSPAPLASEVSVYLASASSDLQDQRDILRREFEDHGYAVLPDKPLPWNAAEIVESVRRDLARSAISIHPLGARYGLIPEGEVRSIVELQCVLAAQHTANRFKWSVWIPPGIRTVEDRQRAFIERLRTGPADASFELLETSVEDVKSSVIGWLQERARPESPSPQLPSNGSGPDTPVRIYLICDQRDREAVARVRRYLFDRGFEATMPLMTGDPEKVREDHQGNLLLVDGVLIYWGAADEFWVRSKVRDLAKARGLGRAAAFQATAIYMADPQTGEKGEFLTHEVHLIRGGGEFSPQTLDSFIVQLNGARDG